MKKPQPDRVPDLTPQIVVATVLVLMVSVMLVGVYWEPLVRFFSDTGRMRETIQSAGAWGPIVFITIQFLQVLIAPIPGQVAGVLAGMMFGPWLGALYSTLGATLGFVLIFILARKLGRPFITKFVKKEHLEKFDYLTNKAGPLVFFLIFLLSGFPDDIICYIAGLSAIPIRTLVFVSLAGRIPGYVLTSFMGAGIGGGQTWLIITVAVASIAVLAFGYWQRETLEHWVRKLAQRSSRT